MFILNTASPWIIPERSTAPQHTRFILPPIHPTKSSLRCLGGIFLFRGRLHLENFMSRPNVIPAFQSTPLHKQGQELRSEQTVAPLHEQSPATYFLRLNNLETFVENEVVQFRSLRHGHVQSILDPSAVNGDHSPIPEQQLHAAGVHVEFAGSFIVLHTRVLSTLRHSCSGLSCFLMIKSGTLFDGSKGFVLFSEEHKKSEPFSYRKKVRILLLWCTSRDSNPGPTD